MRYQSLIRLVGNCAQHQKISCQRFPKRKIATPRLPCAHGLVETGRTVLFRDVDAWCWLPMIAFISQGFNDRIDFLQRHCVYGVLVDPWRENARVAVDFPVRFEVEISIEQLSVDTLE